MKMHPFSQMKIGKEVNYILLKHLILDNKELKWESKVSNLYFFSITVFVQMYHE